MGYVLLGVITFCVVLVAGGFAIWAWNVWKSL